MNILTSLNHASFNKKILKEKKLMLPNHLGGISFFFFMFKWGQKEPGLTST